MSQDQSSSTVSPSALRELYARLGLTPSEEEIAAVVPAVQRLYDNDRVLQERLGLEVEPVPAPRLPAN